MNLNKSTVWALLVVIILAGFALRMYRLAEVPLRGDEAFSAQYWAGLPLTESLTNIATIEPHPVLTYAIFRGWGKLVGTGELPLRALSALVNLLGIAALYGLGKRMGGRFTGLVAALLWALHPLEIWQAQDARNYGMWAGTSAVALWLGWRAIQKNRRIDWILYAVAAALAANIYYNEWLTLAAFSLFVVVTYWKKKRQLIGRLLLAQAPAVITSVLSFVILQGSLLARGGYGGTTGGFDPARLPTFLTTLVFGKDLPLEFTTAIWPLVLLALLIGLWLVWWTNRENAIFLVVSAFVPLLLLCILSLKLNIFAPHYVLSSVPAYILILATFTPPLAPPRKQGGEQRQARLSKVKVFSTVAVGSLWLIGAGYTLRNYYDPANLKSPNWPHALGYVSDYVKPDDLVIQLSVDPAFGYYYHLPALNIALPSYPAQTVEDIQARLAEYTADRKHVWMVGQTFPDWPNYGVVESWMNEHFQSVLKTQASGLHVEEFMPLEVSADEIADAPFTTFGDVAELMGVEITYPSEANSDLTVLLYWRAKNQSDVPLKVFIHLHLGGDNPILAQDDQYPQDGRIGTDSWETGSVYRDVYQLPLTIAMPASFVLRIGLYDPDANERLETSEGKDSYDYLVMRTILTR